MDLRSEEFGQLRQTFQTFRQCGIEPSFTDQAADVGSRIVSASGPSEQRQRRLPSVFDGQLGAVNGGSSAAQIRVLPRLFEESLSQLEAVSRVLMAGRYGASSHSSDQSEAGGQRHIKSPSSLSRCSPLRRIKPLKNRSRSPMKPSAS